MALPADWQHLRFRRAAGLRIEAHWTGHQYRFEVGLNRGRKARLTMLADELEALLQLQDFQAFERPGAGEWLTRWEEADLVHYTADPRVSRAFTCLPTPGERVADHVRLRPTLQAKGQRTHFGYMPREALLHDAVWVGVELSVLEYEAETLTLAFLGMPPSELATWQIPLGPRPWQQQARHWLQLGAMLAPPPARTGPAVGTVTWLGHAGAMVRVGEASVLVDPMRLSGPAALRPWQSAPPRWAAPSSLAAIVLTHGDHDHFHPETLAQLPKHVPVLVPRATGPAQPYHVAMRRVLDILGFAEVHELACWQPHVVGDVTITATPFIGEDWGLRLPQMTAVVAGPAGRVYLSTDAGAMPSEWQQIAERCGPFDFAFLGVSGCAEPLVCSDDIGYGHMFGPWVDQQRRNQWIELTANPEQAAEATAVLQPRHVFGYAAGGGPWVKLKYSDRGSHDDLVAALHRRGLSDRAVALQPGRAWSLRTGAHVDE